MFRRQFLQLLAGALLLPFVRVPIAKFRERFVSQNAVNGDGSAARPWTLSEALEKSRAGDRVYIKSDGPYVLG